ncbi:MAG: hypothetical protein EAZ78_19225 [Oscillatoriales cyanobacterium]|nr:MAG: hypothetical protein EA000_02935 [Oscillatoriales cyanobacterium]TAD93300.1 MAG: hypothetical protein EAZ98_23305 [Oscillatoriales cyanobacterium]TAE04078.1 MAG: hypothetical protein EAZ96_10600 [Oscillatoriales cyanobacterium]TAF01039.1 MAG: hypothetical protein EAZ78_19225 [Oscillatoriales cyanobacterium]TAF42988.1 MAG: hypothetical protein EAZ68_09280 [Oscillatoriales cyanobacterium]
MDRTRRSSINISHRILDVTFSKIAKNKRHKALQLDRPNPELVQKSDRGIFDPNFDAIQLYISSSCRQTTAGISNQDEIRKNYN